MALLERYLDAVGRHLPPAQEEDILAELRDDIQARLDERASRLGRSLTEDEEADVLKPYGRPILMAARYGKRRQLVGADWFPYYWTTLKIVLAVAVTIQIATVVLLAIAGRPTGAAIGRLFEFPFEAAVTIFGWVTLVFAGLELASSQGKAKDDWNPRALPRAKSARLPRASRVETAIELAVFAIFVAWWMTLRGSAGVMRLPPVVALAPAWTAAYLPVLLVVLASMAAKSVVLIRPDWTDFRLGSGIVTTTAGVIVAGLLLRAGPLILPGEAGIEAQELARILSSLLRWSISIGVVIAVVTTGFDVRRWVRNRKRA